MAQLLDAADDWEFRQDAFTFLRSLQLRTGGPVRFTEVQQFVWRGERVSLMDRQRGIRKPAILPAALSIRTVHVDRPDQRPYADEAGPDGYLRYKWRGTDPDHAENRALRHAHRMNVPMIWFQGFQSGVYLPVFPVWLVEEEPKSHQFVVALDELQRSRWSPQLDGELERSYADATSKRRLHQPLFRARVLAAYGNKCAVCRFRHTQLLDAAHIKPDSEGGEPVVVNGLSLCRIHHGAYDAHLIGIRPDKEIIVRPDVLEEVDGPTLEHSIKAMHGVQIQVPRSRASHPDKDLLAERFEQFEAAAA